MYVHCSCCQCCGCKLATLCPCPCSQPHTYSPFNQSATTHSLRSGMSYRWGRALVLLHRLTQCQSSMRALEVKVVDCIFSVPNGIAMSGQDQAPLFSAKTFDRSDSVVAKEIASGMCLYQISFSSTWMHHCHSSAGGLTLAPGQTSPDDFVQKHFYQGGRRRSISDTNMQKAAKESRMKPPRAARSMESRATTLYTTAIMPSFFQLNICHLQRCVFQVVHIGHTATTADSSFAGPPTAHVRA